MIVFVSSVPPIWGMKPGAVYPLTMDGKTVGKCYMLTDREISEHHVIDKDHTCKFNARFEVTSKEAETELRNKLRLAWQV